MKNNILLIVILGLHGCSTLDPIYFKRSSIAFDKNNTQGSMSVWNSDLSASIENRNGKVCMQRAMTAKSFNRKTEAKFSDSILQMSKGIINNNNSTPKDLVNFQNEVKETLSLLTTSTERTTYLDIGLFYICQMAMNENINQQQTTELINILIERSSQVEPNKFK